MNTMAARPTLQQMLKNAMAGASVGSTKIAQEAQRQLENLDGESGQQSDAQQPDQAEEKISGAYARKLASAVEYCAELIKTGADLAGPYNLTENKVEPGKGPGALQVMEAPGGPPPSENVGQATAGNQPPKNPGLQKQLASGTDAATQLDNDINHRPGADAEAGWAPMGDHSKLSMSQRIKMAAQGKTAGQMADYMVGGVPGLMLGDKARQAGVDAGDAALYPQMTGLAGTALGGIGGAGLGALIGRATGKGNTGPGATLGALGGTLAGTLGGVGYGWHSKNKELDALIAAKKAQEAEKGASVTAIRKLAAQRKQAEEAINPAHISAGAAQAPQTIEANQPGPGGEYKGLVPTTPKEVANFTRREAKAPMKQEMRQYVDEPMMSESSDKVLANAFGHTDEAGAKISSAQEVSKVASARALMRRLAESAGVNPVTFR